MEIRTIHSVLECEYYKFEKVTEFKYSGTLITMNNSMTTEVNHQTAKVNKCYIRLIVPKGSHLSIKTKCELYKMLL